MTSQYFFAVMYSLILASSSKNRKELFSCLNIPFKVEEPTCNESEIQDTSSLLLTQKRAYAKMESVAKNHKNEKVVVIGADTVVEASGAIFGKPKSVEDAKQMFKIYSNSSHLVISSIALINLHTNEEQQVSSVSKVYFKKLEDCEIDEYLKTDDWKGVAGGYKIQGIATLFVEKIEGSYSGIVGLPMSDFYSCLKKLCGEMNIYDLILKHKNDF